MKFYHDDIQRCRFRNKYFLQIIKRQIHYYDFQIRIIIVIIILLFWEFFAPALADGFSQEFEWQQVSKTLLSILAYLNNVLWMVSTHPLISRPSCPLINPLVSVPSAPITIGITVSFFMFHSYSFLVLWQGRSTNLLFRFLSVLSSGQLERQNPLFSRFTFFFFSFFFCWLSLDLIVWPRLDDSFYYYYYLLIRVFHISDSWWSFTRV